MGLNGVELIKECSIELTIGRRYGLIGQNGSGKTNFLQCIANREVRTSWRPGQGAGLGGADSWTRDVAQGSILKQGAWQSRRERLMWALCCIWEASCMLMWVQSSSRVAKADVCHCRLVESRQPSGLDCLC